jgi:hypothetical protein
LSSTAFSTYTERANEYQNASKRDVQIIPSVFCYGHGGEFADRYGALCVAGAWLLSLWGGIIWRDRRILGGFLLALGLVLDIAATASGLIGCLPWNLWGCLHDGQDHHSEHSMPHIDKVYH